MSLGDNNINFLMDHANQDGRSDGMPRSLTSPLPRKLTSNPPVRKESEGALGPPTPNASKAWHAHLSFSMKGKGAKLSNAIWSRGRSAEYQDDNAGTEQEMTNKDTIRDYPSPPPDNAAGCCLVLLNLQNDFFPGGPAHPDGVDEDYARKINALKALRV